MNIRNKVLSTAIASALAVGVAQAQEPCECANDADENHGRTGAMSTSAATSQSSDDRGMRTDNRDSRADNRNARNDDRNARNDDRNARASNAGENILTEEEYDEIYSRGMSADDLLDADVVDAEGDIMGEVEDLIVGPDDNRLIGMVVETGGFLEIGDSHLLYPFDKAQIRSSEEVQVPNLDGEQVEELSLYQEIEGEDLGSRWRVTELIGSFAYAGGEPYGRIDDVIVDKSGDIMAVVVEPDVMYEDYDAYYAWPYAGYYYDPVAGIYDWPIGHDHVFGLEPFEPL